MKKIFLILNFLFFIFNFSSAQPTIQWQKCFGGTYYDQAYSLRQTTDGGFIIAGYASSNNGNVTGNHGAADYWIVKLDSFGNLQWQKCFGGTDNDYANSIQQTAEGGYIIAGYTLSNDGDITGYHGNVDYWIVKLNGTGNIEWKKCYGGTTWDFAFSIQQTTDGGYVVAGVSLSNDGDVTGHHGNASTGDYWIAKLDTIGNIQWQKSLGGTLDDAPTYVQQTMEGGYIAAGIANSTDGDVTGNHGSGDSWIVNLDGTGTLQWQKCFGGTSLDRAFSIQQSADGGYIIVGYTYSNDGDVTGYHGYYDVWVVKLDSSINLQWQKCLGGDTIDNARSVIQTSDGGFIVAATTISNDGDVTGNHGNADYWVVKLNGSGTLQWQKCFGGTGDDLSYSIQQTADGGFIIAGSTDSNDGDVTGNHGDSDFWIVKLAPYVGIEEEKDNSTFSISPNPFSTTTTISFGKETHNATFSLYNLLGEKVAEASDISGESFQLNRGNLPSGVYVFEVTEKDKNICRGKAVVH